MQFTTKTGSLSKISTACLVVAVHEKRKTLPEVATLDKAMNGAISALLKSGDMDGKVGSTLMIHNPTGVNAKRILLVGCGEIKSTSAKQFRKIAMTSAKALKSLPVSEVISSLSSTTVDELDLTTKVRAEIEAYGISSYTFEQLKSKKSAVRKKQPKSIAFHSHNRSEPIRSTPPLRRALLLAPAQN